MKVCNQTEVRVRKCPTLFSLCVYDRDSGSEAEKTDKLLWLNAFLMNDCSLPQLLLRQFLLGPWSNNLLFMFWSVLRFILQDVFWVRSYKRSHINWWFEGNGTTVTAGRAEPEHLTGRLLLFCFHVKLLQGKLERLWHKRLLVNNFLGHTEHVWPTKTIQLRVLRLPFCARACSIPALFLYRHRYRKTVAEIPIVLP